jgi:DNA-binding GntR family transcriptional regulator
MTRPRTTPALTTTRVTFDEGGQALEVLHTTALADAAQFVYERLPINA